MIILFLLFSCISCWKVCVWLSKYEVVFEEYNIIISLFNKEELL